MIRLSKENGTSPNVTAELMMAQAVNVENAPMSTTSKARANGSLFGGNTRSIKPRHCDIGHQPRVDGREQLQEGMKE